MVDIKPIIRPVKAAWDLTLTKTEYTKLLKGFTPQMMEDKWTCQAEKPDSYGNTVVHLACGWEAYGTYELKIRGGNPARIVQITWETNKENIPEHQAKKNAINLCDSLTGTELKQHQMHKSHHHISRESRIIGALLALHAGDSLGATCEFDTHAKIAQEYPHGLDRIIGGGPFNWPAGNATDDTDMTRGVLLAYSTVKPGQDVAALAGDNFLDWLKGDWPGRKLDSSPVDIGGATSNGLRNYKETHDVNHSGVGPGSAGNGSLMRCLPTGLFQPDKTKLIAESIRISRITHRDLRCTISCAVYNWIVSNLVDGATPHEAVKAGETLAEKLADESYNDDHHKSGGNKLGTKYEVRDALRLARKIDLPRMAANGPPADMLPGKCSGYVIETLALAVAALLDERPLKRVLVDVVRVGKDTDTNGAVAGGLLGARDGEDAVPREWRNRLQFGGEFKALARLIILRRKHYKGE